MFYPDWLILRILHQSFEIERPKGNWSEVVVHMYIYISITPFIVVFFIHSTVFLFVNRDDLKEFVFSHDKAASLLKEDFHALEMDKTHIYVVFTY